MPTRFRVKSAREAVRRFRSAAPCAAQDDEVHLGALASLIPALRPWALTARLASIATAVYRLFDPAAGDRLLVEPAKRLRGVLRTEDVAARLGGDDRDPSRRPAGPRDRPLRRRAGHRLVAGPRPRMGLPTVPPLFNGAKT